ncbi:hypothetical protein CCICO_08130 [Corynebacterium ciconiae DSM 44920]|uniref:hypothetical protein n=1 Tax=Corynebacterium ciconiae TaxID=227319 RepID=UPI00037DC188|nr:hypothetical protein [Corynebacterium ciconiae]WKD61642.1 hypothetical protein CCICO_08130 [Corynebacterium ciconiae DSM 44920]
MSDHSGADLESKLKAKLAEAEKYAASIRADIASLSKKADDPESVAEQDLQHDAVDHLDDYIKQTHVHWHTIVEFLEDAIAELRPGHKDEDQDEVAEQQVASTSSEDEGPKSTAEKAPSVQTPREDTTSP